MIVTILLLLLLLLAVVVVVVVCSRRRSYDGDVSLIHTTVYINRTNCIVEHANYYISFS
jgi:hypothetical protein